MLLFNLEPPSLFGSSGHLGRVSFAYYTLVDWEAAVLCGCALWITQIFLTSLELGPMSTLLFHPVLVFRRRFFTSVAYRVVG